MVYHNNPIRTVLAPREPLKLVTQPTNKPSIGSTRPVFRSAISLPDCSSVTRSNRDIQRDFGLGPAGDLNEPNRGVRLSTASISSSVSRISPSSPSRISRNDGVIPIKHVECTTISSPNPLFPPLHSRPFVTRSLTTPHEWSLGSLPPPKRSLITVAELNTSSIGIRQKPLEKEAQTSSPWSTLNETALRSAPAEPKLCQVDVTTSYNFPLSARSESRERTLQRKASIRQEGLRLKRPGHVRSGSEPVILSEPIDIQPRHTTRHARAHSIKSRNATDKDFRPSLSTMGSNSPSAPRARSNSFSRFWTRESKPDAAISGAFMALSTNGSEDEDDDEGEEMFSMEGGEIGEPVFIGFNQM
jgi:hypothetical protein